MARIRGETEAAAAAARRKREEALARAKATMEEVREQALERKARRKAEAEEMARLEREWAAAMECKDRDRHTAFRRVLARQEAKQNSYATTVQEELRKQQRADEARAEQYRRDAEALPWMAGFRRDPWPRRVVWEQDDVVHRRFYWLEVPREAVLKERARVTATVDGQRIDLDGDLPAAWGLRLSDRLVDLDQPVTVSRGGRVLFEGPVHRTAWAIRRSLDQRADPASAGPGWLSLTPGE